MHEIEVRTKTHENSAGAKTFGEWCDNSTKFVTSHFTERCTRVDLVFDQYTPNSIKASTRMKRKGGKKKGIRLSLIHI